MSGVLAAIVGSGAPGTVALPASIEAIEVGTSAGISLENDGDYDAGFGGAGEWVTPSDAGHAQLYEARASSLAGDTGNATGTFDTWLSLDTTRAWGVSGNNVSVTFTLEIRDRSTQVVRDSCALTCTTSDV